MRAIAVKAFKQPPELLELPVPVPAKGELLVKISAASLNPFDWRVIDGILDGKMPHTFPLVLGSDAVGVVTQLGDGVTRFKVGDRIFGQFLHAPVGMGTYAEYVSVPQTNPLAILPEGIDSTTGAALPTAGLTALALVEQLQLKPGKSVLIIGATGGVGSFATQFAVAHGLRVFATATSHQAGRVRLLGASETFDQRGQDLIEALQMAFPDGIDGLIDLINDPAGFAALTALIRPGGVAWSTLWSANPEALKQKGIVGGNIEFKPSGPMLDVIAEAILVGKLVAPIDTIIPLEQAPEAIERSRRGQARGKTILMVRDDDDA